MHNNTDFTALTPVEVTGADFLAAFHDGPYAFRTFPDQGSGPGKNYTVTRLAEIQAALTAANSQDRRGIFFVVNQGGHRDEEIDGSAPILWKPTRFPTAPISAGSRKPWQPILTVTR